MEKLCNAIGLPPMLCMFVVLGVCGWPGVGNAIAVSVNGNRRVVIAAHPLQHCYDAFLWKLPCSSNRAQIAKLQR